MKNVYEVEAEATDGPWGHESGVVTCADDGEHIGSFLTNTLAENQPGYHRKNGRASAAYAAHCRNNFMKALNALKAEHDLHRGYTGGPCYSGCKTCILIKELEEVK